MHTLKIRKAMQMNWSHFHGCCTHPPIRWHGMLRMLFPVSYHWQGKRKQGDARRIGFISREAALTHSTNKETECLLKDTKSTVIGGSSRCEHRDYPHSYALVCLVSWASVSMFSNNFNWGGSIETTHTWRPDTLAKALLCSTKHHKHTHVSSVIFICDNM